ncbi:MAG TPA: YtxH domain-containing protein [Bacteroidia bacterium]|nr:YtxH domain-containing protein [Bacteroidia bacterium]
MENNKSKILWGLAIGAAAGFVLGYLFSGKKVSEMGDDLNNMTYKIKDKFKDTLDKSKEAFNDMNEKVNSQHSSQS